MIDKILTFIAIIPAIFVATISIMTYELNVDSHELEKKKVSEGINIPKELKIRSYGMQEITKTLRNLDEASVDIKVKNQAIDNLFSINYVIENIGKSPILKKDFSEKLTAKFPKEWEVLIVKNTNSSPPSLQPNWTLIDKNKIQLEPSLLNPDDKIYIVVYLSNLSEEFFRRPQ